MTEFVEYDFGKAGGEYFKAELSEWAGLAHDSGDLLPWAEGRAVTLLPKGTSRERARAFKTGGVGWDDDGCRGWLMNHCQKRMKQYPLCSVVSQDDCAAPSDSWVKHSDRPMFFHDNVVYYYQNCPDMNRDRLSSVLYTGQFGVAFLLKCGIAPSIQKQFISDETYQGLLDNIVDVLIKVYDAESYLLWMSKPYPE